MDGREVVSKKGDVWKVESVLGKWKRAAELRSKFEQVGSYLCVRNLDPGIGEETFKEMISKFGTVVYHKLMLGPEGESLGFGFVAYSTRDEALDAIAKMNGTRVMMKYISVRIARRKEKNVNAKLLRQSEEIFTGVM